MPTVLEIPTRPSQNQTFLVVLEGVEYRFTLVYRGVEAPLPQSSTAAPVVSLPVTAAAGAQVGANTAQNGTYTAADGTVAPVYQSNGTSQSYIGNVVSLRVATYRLRVSAKRISGTATNGSIVTGQFFDGTATVRKTISMSEVPVNGEGVYQVEFTNLRAGKYTQYFFGDVGSSNQVALWKGQLEEVPGAVTNAPTTEQWGGWILDVDQGSAVIMHGIPLVTGADLFAPFRYLGLKGSLVVASAGDENNPPTFDNLGTEAKLYYVVSA